MPLSVVSPRPLWGAGGTSGVVEVVLTVPLLLGVSLLMILVTRVVQYFSVGGGVVANVAGV